jgi:hypothetical protein
LLPQSRPQSRQYRFQPQYESERSFPHPVVTSNLAILINSRNPDRCGSRKGGDQQTRKPRVQVVYYEYFENKILVINILPHIVWVAGAQVACSQYFRRSIRDFFSSRSPPLWNIPRRSEASGKSTPGELVWGRRDFISEINPTYRYLKATFSQMVAVKFAILPLVYYMGSCVPINKTRDSDPGVATGSLHRRRGSAS